MSDGIIFVQSHFETSFLSSVFTSHNASNSRVSKVSKIVLKFFIMSEARFTAAENVLFFSSVYTTTNTQRIAIYPGKFKFISVKISPDSERLHGLLCLHECAIRKVLILVQLCCEFTSLNVLTL